jgi:hypothetical protein
MKTAHRSPRPLPLGIEGHLLPHVAEAVGAAEQPAARAVPLAIQHTSCTTRPPGVSFPARSPGTPPLRTQRSQIHRNAHAHRDALTRLTLVEAARPDRKPRRVAVEPNGCLIEAPWLVHGGHGASSRQPLGLPGRHPPLAGVVRAPADDMPSLEEWVRRLARRREGVVRHEVLQEQGGHGLGHAAVQRQPTPAPAPDGRTAPMNRWLIVNVLGQRRPSNPTHGRQAGGARWDKSARAMHGASLTDSR